ncbi:MAG: IclR family transcriptional regulator [Paracoccus sp. (in: a-proteobacteria)]|nr:IclR family transcriptional regulator [Paracoccus sp. (in: a-proteobacteria)]
MSKTDHPAAADTPVRPQRGIRTLEAMGTLLRAMARAGQPIKLRDLAEAVDVAPAQLHPYLVSLRAIGMVEQLGTGLYQLGPFALELGLIRLRAQDAYNEAIARIPQLVDETKLMVALSVWGLHGVTIVYVREGAALIHANVRAGGGFALTATATGRLFAAFLPQEVTAPVIERELLERDNSEKGFRFDRAEYAHKLAEIRRQGFEITLDAPIPGVSAVTAPVFDFTGEIQLSVTVIGPTSLTDLGPGGATITQNVAFCRNLSKDLGYITPPAEPGPQAG